MWTSYPHSVPRNTVNYFSSHTREMKATQVRTPRSKQKSKNGARQISRAQALLSAVKNKPAGYLVAGTLFTEETKVLRVGGSGQGYLVGSTSFQPPLTHINAEEEAALQARCSGDRAASSRSATMVARWGSVLGQRWQCSSWYKRFSLQGFHSQCKHRGPATLWFSGISMTSSLPLHRSHMVR